MVTSGTSDVIAGIVVHHRNYPEVVGTVHSLLAAGVEGDRLVVVDNSEDPVVEENLRAALSAPVRILTVPNRGYAHAVNSGVRHLAAEGVLREFTLVATHEVKVHAAAVHHLVGAMRATPAAMVAGPTLLVRDDAEDRIWSAGGRLTRWLNKPKARLAGARLDTIRETAPVATHWLDGAFCLYRTSWLQAYPMPEQYFLAFEELDYHTTIRRAGGVVLWCPRALVWQRANGVSSYLFGRNMQLFQRAHGNLLQQSLAVPAVIARNLLRSLVRRPGPLDTREVIRGWLTGLGLRRDPYRPAPPRTR